MDAMDSPMGISAWPCHRRCHWHGCDKVNSRQSRIHITSVWTVREYCTSAARISFAMSEHDAWQTLTFSMFGAAYLEESFHLLNIKVISFVRKCRSGRARLQRRAQGCAGGEKLDFGFTWLHPTRQRDSARGTGVKACQSAEKACTILHNCLREDTSVTCAYAYVADFSSTAWAFSSIIPTRRA